MIKKIIFAFLFFSVFYFLVHIIAVTVVFGGFISKKTEQKYLRNINKFKWEDGIMYRDVDYSDSLAFIAPIPLNAFNPFCKWYIGKDVGCISAGSKLSKKLDSIYYAHKNKLK